MRPEDQAHETSSVVNEREAKASLSASSHAKEAGTTTATRQTPAGVDSSITFKIHDLVDNVLTATILDGPCRVLGFRVPRDKRERSICTGTQICLIRLPRIDPVRPKRRLDYMPAPFFMSLEELQRAVASCHVHVLNEKKQKYQPDDVALREAPNDEASKKLRDRFSERDQRWELIRPLVKDGDSQPVRPTIETLLRPNLGAEIRARAKEVGQSPTTIYTLLHRYWAGKSRKDALLSDYSAVGAPGVSKAQNVKLGRRTRLQKAKPEGGKNEGYVLDKGKGADSEKRQESDKAKLAHGYRLIKHGTRARTAYLLTMATHWAWHELLPNGEKTAKLFPRNRRPTYDQFLYWGKKLSDNKGVLELQTGSRRWRQQVGSRGGSVRDQVATVFHMFVFDGTSCDVYVTSMRSRLKKLPPMTRLVVKESRTGVIMGWYCGWLPASPRTALMALLCAAKSKVPILAKFGIPATDEEWPCGVARKILVDNGELKAQAASEAEDQFGFSMEWTPSFAGEKKGDIEGQHHVDHKELDHRLPGNTGGGKHLERGQEHASVSALWTRHEYMRELLLHWRDVNNEVVPDLAPLDMLLMNPEISPTRVNILNWMRSHGASSELVIDTEAFEAFCLPDTKAVIRKNGLYLMAKVGGYDVVLPRLRYTSDELLKSGLLEEVRRLHKTIPTMVKMDPENLDEVWLPHAGGMMRLHCTANDTTLVNKFTLTDYVEMQEHQTLGGDLAADDDDQREVDKHLRRAGVTHAAAKEMRDEVAKTGIKVTKGSARRSLRQNVIDEMALLDDLERQDQATSVEGAPTQAIEPETADITDDSAAARAMMSLNDEEFE